jgi:putative FmdB family regulatory protein
MPIYDYRCDDCGTTYDVLHKVREVVEDVSCPSCGSQRHTRLISAPAIGTKGHKVDFGPSCGNPDCCGGACSMN